MSVKSGRPAIVKITRSGIGFARECAYIEPKRERFFPAALYI
jgi:hypothetical protein